MPEIPEEEEDENPKRDLLKIIREAIVFYTTIFFSLCAIFSAAGFCFLVPFYIDPALSTLQYSFLPTNCTTVTGHHLKGKQNCSWSSCREGCTKEIFNCWQVEVSYQLVEEEEGDSNQAPGTRSSQVSTTGKLFPNVKGCGYPPRVVCDQFYQEFGQVGQQFPCFYSQKELGLVMTELDYNEVYMNLLYSTTAPLAVFAVSVFYLVLAYLYIYPMCVDLPEEEEQQPPAEPPPVVEKIPLSTTSSVHSGLGKPNNTKKTLQQLKEEDRKTFRQQHYVLQNSFIDYNS